MKQAEDVVIDEPADLSDELPSDPPGDELPADPPADPPADDPEEVIVTIGEEPAPAEEEDNRAPEWVREVRKSIREKDRENRQLRQELEALKAGSALKPAELGPKPTLEGADYDAERFERELEAWHERKRNADAEERKKQDAAKEAQASWQAKLDAYNKAKAAVKVKDFDEAEEVVTGILSVTQQGQIIDGAKNPEMLIYALGKNPKKAKELASITNPNKFAFAAADLENQLKVTPRKTAPLPETRISGTAPVRGADQQLEKLRAEADKTGDRSKVVSYLRQKRQS